MEKTLAKEIKVSSMLEVGIFMLSLSKVNRFSKFIEEAQNHEFEFSALLRIQTKILLEKASEIQDQDAPETAFGFDYMRNDKS